MRNNPNEETEIENPVLLTHEDGGRVEVQLHPSAEDSQALWAMIQEGFVDLNRKSYEKQDMTEDEFYADMRSDKVLKYVAY